MDDRKRLHGLSILFIDDNSDTREIVTVSLLDQGAHVFLARSAAEALTLLETTRPDIIVSDLSMPGMSGVALMERVRRLRGRPIPAIAFTAFPDMKGDALAAGFDGYLLKPLDPHVLTAEIERVAAL
jgi:CheY-like chemotaxis protein